MKACPVMSRRCIRRTRSSAATSGCASPVDSGEQRFHRIELIGRRSGVGSHGAQPSQQVSTDSVRVGQLAAKRDRTTEQSQLLGAPVRAADRGPRRSGPLRRPRASASPHRGGRRWRRQRRRLLPRRSRPAALTARSITSAKRAMEVPPILLDELRFEHFGIQRMVEPERAVADGHERAGAHGHLQPDPNPAGILAHDLRELVRVHRPATDREHRGKPPRRRRQPEPGLQHRRAEVARERRRALRAPRRRGPRP